MGAPALGVPDPRDRAPHNALRALVTGQALLFGGLLLCVVLDPAGLTANNGVSYYGVRPATVPALAVALLGAGWATRRGLRLLAPATPAPEFVRRCADAFALLLIGVLVTPYTLGTLVDWAHRGLGSALFVLQLVLGLRLVRWTRDPAAGADWSVQLLGGVLSAVFVPATNGYLLQTELLFQLGFGALLLRVAYLLRDHQLGAAQRLPAGAPGSAD